jgi:chitin disaccharide deacetylase
MKISYRATGLPPTVKIMDKRLIINADDLGLSHGITDGILLAHREGILTSASLMVNQPATEYAVEQLSCVPTLDVGIHLNLCQGSPVLPTKSVPSLVDNKGNFLSPAVMGRRLVRWQVSTREIAAEFRAQIDRMLSYGLTPSHADSHHRFHIYPAAVQPFHEAVRSRDILRARAPRKEYWPSNGYVGGAHAGRFYRRILVKTYNDFLQHVVFRKLKLPDAGVAFHPRYRARPEMLREAWISTLENMPEGIYEMCCHPGFPESGFSETDALRSQRELEIRILTDPRLCETVTQAGIELVTFHAL